MEKKIKDYPSFGIRPFLFEGETLSSYLYRIADENKVSIKNVIKDLTKNQKKNMATKLIYAKTTGGSRIDLLPTINFDVNALAAYIKKDKNIVLNHSLFNLYKKFDVREDSEANFLRMVTKIINTRERFFCPICIKKNKGVYKLKWQYSEIDICEEHKCKLINQCVNCGGIQKYVHPGMGEGLCSECNNNLKGEVRPITDYKSLSKALASLNDFYFLVDPDSTLCIQNKDFDKSTSTAITMLYAIQIFFEQKQQSTMKFDNRPLLRVIKATALRRLIWSIAGFNNNRLYLSTLMGALKKINMTLVEFSRLKVPDHYIESIFAYIDILSSKPDSKPICKFKLCPSYNNSKLIYKQKREKIQENYEVFYSPYICMGCFIQYGFNKKKRSWESVGGIIDSINPIRELLKEGYGIHYIAKKTSSSQYQIYKIIGFLLRRNLLDCISTEKYIKLISPFDEVKEIYNCINRDKTISGNFMRKHHIHPLNFYYHYYSREVQKYLFMSMKDQEKNDYLLKAQNFINECLISGKEITFKDFCQEHILTIMLLKKLNIYDTIQTAKEKQFKLRKEEKEEKLISSVNSFFEENSEKLITIKETCELLETSMTNIKKNYPNVFMKVKELCQQRKEHCYREKVNNLKVQAKKIIIKEIESYNEFPQMRQFRKELSLNISKTYYKEVYEYIMELRQSVL